MTKVSMAYTIAKLRKPTTHDPNEVVFIMVRTIRKTMWVILIVGDSIQ